ncbi:CLIP-associating protein 1-like isoform X8 [Biomphalaria glabrata]|uniref:CLIP-associating protein 1-like isoform X8 n=1 Tax=Biomphalaria glabrata TaxID=6526 RepID=A0A9W2YCX2_BIOGL|nr:CLIP-associating protein 1-like isoform X8 [Biomphalaria glabrata]
MSSLDDFIDGVTSQDTKKRLQTHADLIPFLSDPHSSLECQDFNVDQLIEGLAGWVKSSNFKVSLNGLEVLCLMVDRMGENFKPHVTTVLPAVIDRLGDSKDQVRDMAQQLLLKLMMPASTPQYVFDRLGPAFSHKLWHVKEGILLTLQNTINRYGARCLLLSKIVPDICKLLDDPSPQVREAATNALVEIYRHVGEKVRHDLKKIGLSQQRMNVLNSKFEELKLSGNMLPTADVAPSRSSSHNDEPEFDFIKPTSGKPVQRKHSSASSGGPRRISSSTSETKRKRSASAGGSGAVDEELFIKSFEDVSPVKIFSSRDVQEQMMKIKDALNDVNLTWEKRIDHIKLLRSLLMAGAADYDDFFQSLRTLESAFILVVKDLRSQVVREGCVTIAYLSQQLGTKFDHFAESVLPSLMNLIPNSAKVMSTSGIVCIRFIMQFVHTSRLIPIITSNLTSKSNVIRRYSLEFVNQILHSWPTHCLEKHIALLQDAIKRGINDADSEARAHSRKAFWGFADHFKSQADALLLSLDPSKQKMLQGEVSNSSSSSSLNGDIKPRSRSRAASEERSGYGYSPGIAMGVSGMPQRISSSKSDAGANSRSNSPSSARRQLAYAKQTPARVDTGLGPKRTRIPGSHSTGTSREASPARSFKGQERRLSGSSKLSSSGRKTPVLSQKTLRQGPEIEDALQDALSKSSRKRYDQYDSDDAASETSSVCSERSHSSYGGRTSEPSTKERTNQKTRGRTRSFTSGYGVTEDMHSILAQLGSSSHLDRKDGLLSLQHLLRSNRSLSRVELKKVSEMFTRMFHDPHSKVFSVFLDTLIELVYLQSGELGDWLHILLPRLLTKAGGEMLGSVANKVQKALDVIRDCFPFDHQFNTLSKFIIDQSQGPNLKVRVSVLNYLHSLIISMDPSDFVNTMDARLAVSKVISWTMEPRNADVRKASQSVLIALFNLNPAEFSLLLSELPKTFQDGATRILHSHIRAANESTSDVLSPRNVASPQGQNRSRPPSRTSQGHPDDFETENLNPEDIFNSIKKTSADIQSLSINSKLEPYDDVKKEFTSQDSGIQDLRMDSPDGLDHKRAFFNYSQKSAGVIGSATTTLPGGFYNKHEADMSREEVGKILCDIREELANQNERVEQRKNAMLCLQNLVDKGCVTKDLLEEHFKSLLSLLLETLGDQNGDVKVLALKCLQKMLQQFPKYFESFAELTILRVLELHKDDTYRDYTVRTDIKVPYAASEVEDTLVQALPPEQNFRILTPIIQKMEYHMACGAIQMMTKVVEKMPKDVLEASLPHLIPGLFKNFEHKESPVRKASCFCLVAIYLRVEEAMRPFMETLNSHRMKLLNLYIKKRKQEEGK